MVMMMGRIVRPKKILCMLESLRVPLLCYIEGVHRRLRKDFVIMWIAPGILLLHHGQMLLNTGTIEKLLLRCDITWPQLGVAVSWMSSLCSIICSNWHKAGMPSDGGCPMRKILIICRLEDDALVIAFALPSGFMTIIANWLAFIALDPSLSAGQAS